MDDDSAAAVADSVVVLTPKGDVVGAGAGMFVIPRICATSPIISFFVVVTVVELHVLQ